MATMTLYRAIRTIDNYPRYNCGELMAHALRGDSFALDPELMSALEVKLTRISQEIKQKRREFNEDCISSKGKMSQEIKKLL